MFDEVRLNARVSPSTKQRLRIFMAERGLTSYDQLFKTLLDLVQIDIDNKTVPYPPDSDDDFIF